ncbi:hypothetical protein Aperf_G00000025603 [Anoplocephala perfoliata]
MLELLEKYGIDFFVPDLSLVVGTLCPLLTSSSDLTAFASHISSLKNGLTTELVHSLMSAAYERVWLAGSKVNLSKAGNAEKELKDAEEAVWREMLDPGNLREYVPPERQLDVLHGLQVFWNEKGGPKGFVLRCFQNLYQSGLVDKLVFFEWQEEENQAYPVKGKALFEVIGWLKRLGTAEDDGETSDAPATNYINDDLIKTSAPEEQEKQKLSNMAVGFAGAVSTDHHVNGDGDNADETLENSELK